MANIEKVIILPGGNADKIILVDSPANATLMVEIAAPANARKVVVVDDPANAEKAFFVGDGPPGGTLLLADDSSFLLLANGTDQLALT